MPIWIVRSGSSTPAINLTGILQAGSVTVSATKDYTFAGSGDITGSAGLIKTNSGTLTVGGAGLNNQVQVLAGGRLFSSNGLLGGNGVAEGLDRLGIEGALPVRDERTTATPLRMASCRPATIAWVALPSPTPASTIPLAPAATAACTGAPSPFSCA